MRSPIDIYILLPIIIKTIFGIFVPITGIKTMLVDVGVGFGTLTAANFLHHLGDNCTNLKTSVGGRILKSSSDAFAQYFGGMLFSLLVVVIPIFKIPVSVIAKIPGSKYVLENLIWSIGVVATTVILNSVDSASKSQQEICDGTTGVTRMIVSLVVFLLAGVYQYFTI
jgi:hypothetical protein